MRVLSGIQPSGKLHLGNYFGAIKRHISLQTEHECFYFIANFHALTTVREPQHLRDLTEGVALDYLALGLEPQRAVLFRQSDVPEVTELAWILSTVTPKALLERAHSYKDKIAKNLHPTMGLFCYPILMAADILIYRPQLVPVGKDQLQHVEMTQDMAEHFNHTFKSKVLSRPEAQLGDVAVVPGLDGQKMSKSYNNHIELFADWETIRKRIMAIKTDSSPVGTPKDPNGCNAFSILRLLATEAERDEWEQRYRTGSVSYRSIKERICELFLVVFGDARARRSELLCRTAEVDAVLAAGAERARHEAATTMSFVREACGLVTK